MGGWIVAIILAIFTFWSLIHVYDYFEREEKERDKDKTNHE